MLSPTRELASQTEKNIMALGEFMKVRAHCCIGGKSIGAHIKSNLLLKSQRKNVPSRFLQKMGSNLQLLRLHGQAGLR